MTDKQIFPSLYPQLNEWRIDTTFWDEFTAAEVIGREKVESLFDELFEKWKSDAKHLVELCLVTNHKSWQHHGTGNNGYSKYYAECYYKCYDRAFDDDSRLSKEDRTMFYNVID